MKRFSYLALILTLFFFASCKKSESQQEQNKQQGQTGDMKASGTAPKKGSKKGAGSLQIYQEDKLVATIPHEQYATMATTDVKIDDKDYKAILLSDLLKKYNVTGKTITLQGPAKQSAISWEQATGNAIYIYIARNRLQLYTDSKDMESIKLPIVVIKITAAEQAAAAPSSGTGKAKGQKKSAT